MNTIEVIRGILGVWTMTHVKDLRCRFSSRVGSQNSECLLGGPSFSRLVLRFVILCLSLTGVYSS